MDADSENEVQHYRKPGKGSLASVAERAHICT